MTKPQALLLRIMTEYPNAGEKRWREMFMEAIRDDEEMQKMIAKEVFEDLLRRQSN